MLHVALWILLAAGPAPTDGKGWFDHGQVLEEAGDFKGSAVAYDHAFAAKTMPVRSLVRAAASLVRAGDTTGAFEHLQRCADLGFAASKMVEAEPAFEPLKSDARWKAILAKLRDNAEPCLHDPRYAEFDFWLGAWDVFGPGGAKAGTSRIEKVSAGCAVRESWLDAGGNPGTSLNTYDAQARRWRQFWTDSSGDLNQYAGGLADGAMRLEGTSIDRTGRAAHKRMTYSKLAGGRVRQLGEQSADGRSWSVEYDLTYVPVR